jgi:hypothetical protein
VRGGACKLQRSERGRGKQQQAKVLHMILDPASFLTCADQQPSVRPDCGAVQTLIRIYFSGHTT